MSGDFNIAFDIIWSIFFFVPLMLWYTKAHKLRRVEIFVIEIGIFLLSGALYIASDHKNDMVVCFFAIAFTAGMLIAPHSSLRGPSALYEERRKEISIFDDLIFYFFYCSSYAQIYLPVFICPLAGHNRLR
ncbi:MAG: hypothetical protein ACI4CX_04560 [Candidatus Weimeria sp.]